MRALDVFLAERIHRSHHFQDPIFGLRDIFCDSLPAFNLLDTTRNSVSARGYPWAGTYMYTSWAVLFGTR